VNAIAGAMKTVVLALVVYPLHKVIQIVKDDVAVAGAVTWWQ